MNVLPISQSTNYEIAPTSTKANLYRNICCQWCHEGHLRLLVAPRVRIFESLPISFRPQPQESRKTRSQIPKIYFIKNVLGSGVISYKFDWNNFRWTMPITKFSFVSTLLFVIILAIAGRLNKNLPPLPTLQLAQEGNSNQKYQETETYFRRISYKEYST